MDNKDQSPQKMFELKSTSSKVTGGVFPLGRILIGRSESCDFVINSDSISAVHAVLEIHEDHARIYDMNSTNGTYVGDEKVIAKDILPGSVLRFADVEFTLQKTKELPKVAPSVSDVLPSIVYPLASDPKAEFSEYIFEDKNDLSPIFQHGLLKQAVEVIILFKDQIFSVDFLIEGKPMYYIGGSQAKGNDIAFPFLKNDEHFPFIEFQGKKITVHTLPGFSIFFLSDAKKDSGHQTVSVDLDGKDLIRLSKGDLQIFIRSVHAPPQVLPASIFKRDPVLLKYVCASLFAVVLFSAGINLINVPVASQNENQAADRLIRILSTSR